MLERCILATIQQMSSISHLSYGLITMTIGVYVCVCVCMCTYMCVFVR